MVSRFRRFRPSMAAAIVAFVLIDTPVVAALPGTGDDVGKTVVYRDTWGIPHIYAPTAEAGLFAMGWTQAEDRPVELLKNMARGIGESAVFDGPGAVKSDMVAHMWDHYGVSQRGLDTLRPASGKCVSMRATWKAAALIWRVRPTLAWATMPTWIGP